jgi:hypothetical protein
LSIFKDPKTLAETLLKNTVMHLGSIKTDVNNIVADNSSKKYEAMGEATADLMT